LTHALLLAFFQVFAISTLQKHCAYIYFTILLLFSQAFHANFILLIWREKGGPLARLLGLPLSEEAPKRRPMSR
jgi:hypothetical protein